MPPVPVAVASLLNASKKLPADWGVGCGVALSNPNAVPALVPLIPYDALCGGALLSRELACDCVSAVYVERSCWCW